MNRQITLFLILALASFLRFYQLGQNPPALSWDEAAWGYNAYALGIDGRDEFGKFLPHDYLESFGDFKPPVYAYLTILPVKVFGLSEFAVRFPSALFGTLTVLLTYLLVRQIFAIRGQNNTELLALLAAFLLAISPWHINLSKAAFEANVATFFLVLGVWLFLYALRRRPRFLIFSVIALVLSIYTFNTARIVAPLLLLGLAIGLRKELFAQKKEVIMSLVVGIVLILPILPFLFSPQARLRFKEVNIFTDVSVVETVNQEVLNDQYAWWSKLIHNRRFAYGVEFFRHYLDNLSPMFLFIKGDGNPKFSTQDVGQMYIWELPFFVIGIFLLFRKREGLWWLLPYWLLIAIIPAATARETPHALRIEATLPTFQVFVAVGLSSFLQKISNFKFQISNFKIKYLIFSLGFFPLFVGASFLIFNFLYYLHGYYEHYPKEFSGEWQYGYKESIAYVRSVQNEYDKIIITNKLGRPYIYYLFYGKIPPSDFRQSAAVEHDPFGFTNIEGFDKYYFTEAPGDFRNITKRFLYIITGDGVVPAKAEVVKTFYLLNGAPILIAYRF